MNPKWNSKSGIRSEMRKTDGSSRRQCMIAEWSSESITGSEKREN